MNRVRRSEGALAGLVLPLLLLALVVLLAACREEQRGGAPPAADAAAQRHADEIAYYTCSMHTSVRSQEPGTCPICSMTLVPVLESDLKSGVVTLDAGRRQAIGVTTAVVQRRSLTVTIRAVGKVTYDQSRLAEVSVKYPGWIGELYADKPGQEVHRGEALFTLYSPELYSAQQELLAALASHRAAATTSAPGRADYLVRAARQRLHLWDLKDWQIDQITNSGQPLEHVPIVAPLSGYVVEKNVVEGAAVEAGKALFRIARLDQVWVEAELYESELPLVEIGDVATITLPRSPSQPIEGRVGFIYPYLDDATRSGRVRIELANPGLLLKPDMYASVELRRAIGDRIAVPEEAILYAGARRFVFLDLGEGRLRPQRVEVGQRAETWVEIVEGVEEGDVVVTSGNFLIAAESRLKLALEHWK